jgi:hypothetical protein
VLAICGEVADELMRRVEEWDRLLQIEDVNAIALSEDEALHLRVPAIFLVTEVDASFKELLEAYRGISPLCRCHVLVTSLVLLVLPRWST